VNARIHRPQADHLAIAESRGQTREECDECSGTGVVRVGRLLDDPSDERLIECDDCGGTGYSMGLCACSEHRWFLVPDGSRNEDGTSPGAVLVCPRCAVTCYARGCGWVSTVCDAETREQYCDEHWAREVRAYASMIAAMN
jgi:hypothetical protein